MLSALSSYIWGIYDEETETNIPEQPADDQIELENDWIFIKPKDSNDHKLRHVNFYDDSASTASEASSAACGMEDSWLVTPPQCFNNKRQKYNNAETSPMENLLIEHPSMSVYHGNDDAEEDSEEETTNVVGQRGEMHRAVAGRLQELAKKLPLKDLNEKSPSKTSSFKNIKRKNMVHVRNRSTRSNKQYGRQNGKHVGMVGKRGS